MMTPDPIGAGEFAGWMDRLGPWPRPGSAPPVAVAVSGGADSLALALLAAGWAEARGFPVLALVVDHGLREESSGEAALTLRTLERHGIAARLLPLAGLARGPGLAERARDARYQTLLQACAEAGAVDLLLGHHRSDQAETALIRRRASSGVSGLSGMSPLLELDTVRLLRPFLRVDPASLRATLVARGLSWIEDPSNRDRRAERTRVREELATAAVLRAELLRHADAAGQERADARAADAALLAGTVSLRPEGFALLPPVLVPEDALAALIRTVGGRPHRPASEAVRRLVRVPRAATLAGTRLLPAGRWGEGWLLVRETDSLAGPAPALPGARWDGRFVLRGSVPDGEQTFIAALGADAASLRRRSRLPAAVLQALPSLRAADGALLAVPHLGWRADPRVEAVSFRFQPTMPASESTPFSILERL
ncbi:tRNA lysidine(34) synthetase TilS [Acetobacteraceae bacterium KSS8]|uniref:tRNA(Ile)-lysidine synthase n=1 Tax=Endosaccharibacter trunci TaxID=2812733 RepID=A0ABT1W814_9PROT|nr:tRNA lysidine(34) synthetase TilS [Acetobacteraceae bacterium KSS8]